MTVMLKRKNIPSEERLIVALDVDTPEEARALVLRLGVSVHFYKLGLQLCMTEGYFPLLGWLIEQKKQVFADLKFHDIPRTVAAAVENVSRRGASLATIHAGQSAMVEAAAEAAKGTGLKLLAVTVLTSMMEADFADVGYKGTVAELAARRAKDAVAHGADGIVCSGLEAGALRKILGQTPLIVTPGIRASGVAAGDQKRVADVHTALAGSADYLVIGRPILDAPDPARAAAAMQEEIARAVIGD